MRLLVCFGALEGQRQSWRRTLSGNHLEYSRELGYGFFYHLHEGVAARNRGDLGYPAGRLVAVWNHLAVVEILQFLWYDCSFPNRSWRPD